MLQFYSTFTKCPFRVSYNATAASASLKHPFCPPTALSSKGKSGKKELDRQQGQERKYKMPSKSIAASAVSIVATINKTFIGLGEELTTSSLMQAIIRLSFSLYVVNYAFIRFDFFSSRVHNEFVPNAIHLLSKRLIYTYAITILVAYAFHIVIFAPFDALRRQFSISAVKKR